jgi:6-phosphogluconolactonase/Glucosamine-6-phosphate isomerase/deaminase
MQVKIFEDHPELSATVAREIQELVQAKPNTILCMASGETPRLTCQLLVQMIRSGKTDISQLHFIGLDEWVGIEPGNSGSCHYFFQHELITPLGLREDQVHLFDGMSTDLQAECKKMDETIDRLGGIDLIVAGIGMNGHIGFNEPGISPDLYSHVAQLDETTLTVGQKYFDSPTRLQEGITLGLKHLLNARKAILIANGKKKAEVIRSAVRETVSNHLPATIMQTHSNGFIMVDKEAASLL